MGSQSWKKGKGRFSLVDVSEGESFLWVGKTTHKLQHFKANVSIIKYLCPNVIICLPV